MGLSPKTAHYVRLAIFVVLMLAVFIVALTLGLREIKSQKNSSSSSTSSSSSSSKPSQEKPRAKGFRPSKYGKYRFASISSDAEICAEIGADIMGRKGGTAVDAIIAAVICIGAANAHSTGIGGGHFSLIYQTPRGGGKREVVALISRETAPAAAERDMFINASSTIGGKAIGIPGDVKGYYAAWLKYGKVRWEDLFHPTIRLMTEGFPVAFHMAEAAKHNADFLKNSETLREVYVKKNGEVVEEGDIIKDLNLARTLQRIAIDPFTFYNGSLAKDIVADIADAGGIITEEDLRDYTPVFKKATEVKLRNGNYTLYGLPPPSGGVVLQHILQILDGYNLKPEDVKDRAGRALTAHRIMEAFKFAYAKRSALADEDFVDVQELVKNMTSEDYANYIRSKIDDNKTFNLTHYEPAFEINMDRGTSHISVLDQYGNAAAMTSTINLHFGSKVKGKRTGILFNNEMDDFSTPGTINAFGVPASPSNFIVPGKRPQSSMCPSIFLAPDGTPAFIIGGSGGTTITTQVAAVTVNNLWLGFDLKEATDRPRLHHQLLPHEVAYERHNDPELIEDLEDKGHIMTKRKDPDYTGKIQTIRNDCWKCSPDCVNIACIEAVADGRKGGAPNGF